MSGSRWLGSLAGGALLLCAPGAFAQNVTLPMGFQPDPQVLQGLSGGPTAASAMAPSCAGFVPQVAQHRMALPGGLPFIRVWVSSSADTTLAIRAPNGQIFCADDTWQNNPGIDISNAIPGQYDIFVGSFAQGQQDRYTIGFSGARTSSPPAGTGPAQPAQPAQPVQPVQPQQPTQVVIQPAQPVQQPVQVQPAQPIQQPAQPMPPAPYATQNIVLQNGFMPDPRIVAGLAGGPVNAAGWDRACMGYVSQNPNHVISIGDRMRFLRVWAQSQGDTTLAIRFPDGRFYCVDDTHGQNPSVDLRRLPPGNYGVWVGSYTAGQQLPYQLGVSQLRGAGPTNMGQPPGPARGQQQPMPVVQQQPMQPMQPQQPMQPAQPVVGGGATYGSLTINAGFMPDPQQAAGVSGGPIAATTINPQCRGYLPQQPNHVLVMNSPFPFLRLFVRANSDMTLVIRGPRGELYCADDVFGQNPGIDFQNAAPGAYQVFVGSYNPNARDNYTISVTEYTHLRP